MHLGMFLDVSIQSVREMLIPRKREIEARVSPCPFTKRVSQSEGNPPVYFFG